MRGYFQELTNSILVVAPRNLARAEDFFCSMGIKVVTGSCYLGVFFDNREAKDRWLAENVQGWTDSVKMMSWVAHKHPHSAYAGLYKLLQQEWEFVQWFIPNIGDAFSLVEQALRDAFISALFQGLGEGTLGKGVTRVPVKQADLALPDPTKTSPENLMVFCVITIHLVAELRCQEEFRTEDHSACLQEGITEVRKRIVLRVEESLAETIASSLVQGARRLRRTTKTGACLTLQPSTVNGTELGVQEWQEALFLRYVLDSPDLPHYCEGCNATFSICHTLDCK